MRFTCSDDSGHGAKDEQGASDNSNDYRLQESGGAVVVAGRDLFDLDEWQCRYCLNVVEEPETRSYLYCPFCGGSKSPVGV